MSKLYEMHKQTRTKKIKGYVSKAKEKMEQLNVYKMEFDSTIQRYAEIQLQYECLLDEWYEQGCPMTEEYTNKAGATNIRKTASYSLLENLRKELLELENILGLTPKGLKTLKTKGLDSKKASMLDKVLGNGNL